VKGRSVNVGKARRPSIDNTSILLLLRKKKTNTKKNPVDGFGNIKEN